MYVRIKFHIYVDIISKNIKRQYSKYEKIKQLYYTLGNRHEGIKPFIDNLT